MRRRLKQKKGHIELGHRPGERSHGQGEGRRRRWLALLGIAAACASGAGLVAFLLIAVWPGGQSGPPKAAIVDQLSLTSPNPGFVDKAKGMLEAAGFEVDYFAGEEATVNLFRDLPDQDYSYVILRVHSTAVLREQGTAAPTENTVLFTGEPWSETSYLEEQKARHLARTHYATGDQNYYFGITADFIRSRMNGDFGRATILAMGCDGLKSDAAAAAFVDRGAQVVIGWDGEVSASHTDAATELLLHYLLVEKRTPSEAVAQAMADVGPDPSYGSKLLLYPAEAAASSAP